MKNTARVLIVLASLVAASSGSDGYTWIKEYNALYKLHGESEDYVDSAIECLSEDATMFYPNGEEEARDVFELMVPDNLDFIAIGVYKLYDDNDFEAIDGKKDFFTNWDSMEPDFANSFALLSSNLTFTTARGGENHYFICKKYTETCPTTDYSIRLENFDASYKYVTDDSWDKLLMSCLKDDAVLFYPLSQDESKAVFEKLVPKDVERIHIGVQKSRVDSQLRTIDGKTEFYNSDWNPDGLENFTLSLGRDLEYGIGEEFEIGSGVCVKRNKNENKISCPLSEIVTINGGNIMYEFHSKYATWYEAEEICKARNAILAMPSNRLGISSILEDLKIKCTGLKGSWLGFRYLRNSHSRVDRQNSSIDENEHDWIKANSRCYIRGCGSMTAFGYLNEHNCQDKMNFVCQYSKYEEPKSKESKKDVNVRNELETNNGVNKVKGENIVMLTTVFWTLFTMLKN